MKIRKFTLALLLINLIGSVLAVINIAFQLNLVISLTPILTISSFLFAILHSGQREGWMKTLILVMIVFATGLLFESVGVATGRVYGPYHYTDLLGSKFLGLVPYLIPVAWTFMMYPSMLIARVLTPNHLTGFVKGGFIAAISGLVMTAWDVVMDPIMVLGEHWVWEVEGVFFGIPLQNFWGWWLTTFFAVGIYQLITRKLPKKEPQISDRFAVYLYTLTGTTTIANSLLVDLHGSALAGFFAMLPWMIMGLVKTSENCVLKE